MYTQRVHTEKLLLICCIFLLKTQIIYYYYYIVLIVQTNIQYMQGNTPRKNVRHDYCRRAYDSLSTVDEF